MTDKDRLKLLLGIPESDTAVDDRLVLLLDMAHSYLLSYCRVHMTKEASRGLVLRMAAEDFGRLGGEGVSFRNMSGAAESYRGTYSDDIMRELRRLRRLGGVEEC